MEEEKAAAYYEELTRKGEGAARFKQGLGFSSQSSDTINPTRGSALLSSTSFLNNFVRASIPEKSTEVIQKKIQLENVQNKLKKKQNSESIPRVSEKRSSSKERDKSSRRRSTSRDRNDSRKRYRLSSRERDGSSRSSTSSDRNDSRRRYRSSSRDRGGDRYTQRKLERRKRSRSRSSSSDERKRRHLSSSRDRAVGDRDRKSESRRRNRSRSSSSDKEKWRRSSREIHSRGRRSRSSSPGNRRSNKGRDDRHRSKIEGKKEKERNGEVDYSRLIKGYAEMTPAERVKAKMKLQLAQTAEKDSTKGMGAGWERFEFNKDAPLDQDEEMEVAEDDRNLVKKVSQSFRFSEVETRKEEQIKAAHDEAMFGVPTAQASSLAEKELKDPILEDAGRESKESDLGTSLLSEKVLAKQSGSWRDRARKLKDG